MSPTRYADNLLAWGLDGIEQNTLDQATQTAALPFIAGHVALMPDAHLGFGSTVGSVIPTQGAIIPSAIGVDIGCGMIAGRLDLTASDLPDNLGPLHGLIRDAVPAGVGKGHDVEDAGLSFMTSRTTPLAVLDSEKLRKRATTQFGSLGSGNHFVEVCLDEQDRVWVVLHSGSRGVGKELADRHINRAKGLMKDWFITLDEPDLAYLVQGTAEFTQYIFDMHWAQAYALANRALMLRAVHDAVNTFMGDRPVELVEQINCHHNFTEQEHHHGRNVWLTRKGAIRAREGDRGVIPGSMGTASYIVTGLGNPASYDSCSHGAGRRMSRGEARRTFTPADLEDRMRGKTWNDRDAKQLLDEIPDSYKDIDAVMAAQADLVRVDHTLHQVLNYKGT